MTTSTSYSASSESTSQRVADVLSALGALMRELHQQDLALQNAISKLATQSPSQSAQVVHIQHIDLLTQTHEDLARFLPELAASLSETKFDQAKLGDILRLQSLRDQLLNKEEDRQKAQTPSGDLSLF